MDSKQVAISNTISYARQFDYDLTLGELHHWLITPGLVSLSSLKKFLSKTRLRSSISIKLTPKRLRRRTLTQNKLSLATSAFALLSFFPSIKLIALTGSLAMNNASPKDDIDLMIVTSAHSLWLSRLFILPLLRLFFNTRLPQQTTSRNSLCPNLWLDTLSLAVPLQKRSLYTAHEVLQIKPLLNRDQTYEKFIRHNSWTKKYLFNAYKLTTANFPVSSKRGTNALNWIGYLLLPLNLLAFLLQYLYMRPKITHEHITLHSAFFHPHPHPIFTNSNHRY